MAWWGSMVAGGVALISAVATAAAAPSAPPVMTEAGISKWIASNLKVEGWTLIVMEAGGGIVFGGPDGVYVLQDGTHKTLLRNEYFEPHKIGPMDVRSTTQTWNIDCGARRIRVLDMTIFAENNMGGQSMSRAFDEPAWTGVTEADLVKSRIVKRVCEAPTTGKRLR